MAVRSRRRTSLGRGWHAAEVGSAGWLGQGDCASLRGVQRLECEAIAPSHRLAKNRARTSSPSARAAVTGFGVAQTSAAVPCTTRALAAKASSSKAPASAVASSALQAISRPTHPGVIATTVTSLHDLIRAANVDAKHMSPLTRRGAATNQLQLPRGWRRCSP